MTERNRTKPQREPSKKRVKASIAQRAPQRSQSSKSSQKPPRDDCYYGRNAVLALARKRPDEISRLHYDEASNDSTLEAALAPLLKKLAARRKPFRTGTSAELEKIAGSPHHGGLVAFAPAPKVGNVLSKEKSATGIVLVLLDVQNPHNIGAIYRSAAHFGARAIAFVGAHPRLSGSLARVSEGGVEFVTTLQFDSLETLLQQLKRTGYHACATAPESSNLEASISLQSLPGKLAVILGNEEHGLPESVMQRVGSHLTIPGTGAVESLNVAASATSILTAWRVRRQSPLLNCPARRSQTRA